MRKAMPERINESKIMRTLEARTPPGFWKIIKLGEILNDFDLRDPRFDLSLISILTRFC